MSSILALVAPLVLSASAAAQLTGIANSPHNLSASGPGAVRASIESEVCIFCHTPHSASPVLPLWNRATPAASYSIYASRSLDAVPGQPTGASKMCLSCHDGTIALGAVLSRSTPISMSGFATMPPGHANIGTDLRDDHPISFRFDSALAARDPKLRAPAALPPEIRLDANAELQCTACHDAHDNSLGDFLVMRNSASQLCLSCHEVGSTSIAAHRDCAECHQPHAAPSGPFLLRRPTVTETCLRCHNGLMPGAADIASDLRRFSVHDSTGRPAHPAEPHESTDCTSCHEPHTMGHGSAPAPSIHPSMGRRPGINASGSPVRQATHEYETCFECHGDRTRRQPSIARRIIQNNTRLQFSPSAISSHPVVAQGRNPRIPSLLPHLSSGSLIHCSDCHASDTGRSAGGAGPSGVHGSNFGPLLKARYETADYTSESASVYALCYACHDRASILADESFRGHRRHIVDLRTPCAACHDAHGISSTQGSPSANTHLMNFASSIVFPDPTTGRFEFRDTGVFSGECFLSCHGVSHSPRTYSAFGP